MISKNLSDDAILRELGARLAAARVQARLTQAMLADAAGVSKRTVERLESGTTGAQLASLIRVCRVLGLMEGFDALVPPAVPGPMDQLKLAGRARKRVRAAAAVSSSPSGAIPTPMPDGRLANQPKAAYGAAPQWTWGEPHRAPQRPPVELPAHTTTATAHGKKRRSRT